MSKPSTPPYSSASAPGLPPTELNTGEEQPPSELPTGEALTARVRATREAQRLHEDAERLHDWKRWGPYLSERQWGTVREDYSGGGDAWNDLPHDHARSRAYRWGEDGLLGICDRKGRLALALALWNERDPILKERLFGLTGPQGNHGEDVKELYYFLDNTPTHSYQRGLYKYPQTRFPYEALRDENQARGRQDDEYELGDTGAFDHNRYFDVEVEYAKAAPEDILVAITVTNRAEESARLHVLPQVWFRNTWSWGVTEGEDTPSRPRLWAADLPASGQGTRRNKRSASPQVVPTSPACILAEHSSLGHFALWAAPQGDQAPPELLFTENDTNTERLYGSSNSTPYVKDAFHRRVVDREIDAVNPAGRGTKAAVWYVLELEGGASTTLQLRLTRLPAAGPKPLAAPVFGEAFEQVVQGAREDADAFYSAILPAHLKDAQRQVARQAYAGLLWSKQFYHYSVQQWLDGDPGQPPPPDERRQGRNHEWAAHLYNRDIISMPDTWEYPWYAAWDLAFHAVALSRVDPRFAREQLLLLCREWYMHPNGQLPAYEWNFGDVNPPVHAWAALRIYRMTGRRQRDFLERIFHKLLINFTWWVNRTDKHGTNIFAGGFLGLDNVGVFDRSHFPSHLGELEQADATAWMAFYCLRMLQIALELARDNPVYEDVASKFFEHFVGIVDAINSLGGERDAAGRLDGSERKGLWDEEDGFYYDVVRSEQGTFPLRVRSTVGLLPLIAVEILEHEQIERMPGFAARLQWFVRNGSLAHHLTWSLPSSGDGKQTRILLAAVERDRLERLLKRLFDEDEFLSPYGIRSLSRAHAEDPYTLRVDGQAFCVDYEPAESRTPMFGGNSNWRGPVWFPTNVLLIESLQRYHQFYGDDFTIEYPTGSGVRLTLDAIARDLQARLGSLFLQGPGGRPSHGGDLRYRDDPAWRDLVLFYEYFDGEHGKGLGASHQTGWTALVARCLEGAGPDDAFTAAVATGLEGPWGHREGPALKPLANPNMAPSLVTASDRASITAPAPAPKPGPVRRAAPRARRGARA